MSTELFEIVDEDDKVIGLAPRSKCHGDPSLVHRVAHVLVFNHQGDLLLQKRAAGKDIQPDKWDTSVGGHLDPGEDYRQAARREMVEELGVDGVPLTFLYKSKIRNEIESENVATYLALTDAREFAYSTAEISAVRFWSPGEIEASLGSGSFTPNFEEEWQMFSDWQRRYLTGAGSQNGFCAGASFPDLVARLQAESDE